MDGVDHGHPRAVIYAATEDSWERTIAGHLIAAGADMSRVFRVDVHHTGPAGAVVLPLSLPRDCDALTDAITAHDVALLVLDPLISAVDSRINVNQEELRTALEPLAALTDRTGAAVFGLAHFNKAGGTDVLSRITGSRAFAAVARAAIAFARDRDGSCVISQAKNNLGPLDLPSLRYRIESVELDTAEGPAEWGRLVMLGETDVHVDDLLHQADAGPSREGDRGERREIDTWPATAHQVHRTARTAFGEALKHGHLLRNPVALAKAPRVDEEEIEPFDVDEVRRLMTSALTRRNGVRFVLALAIGTRQGETIGIKWSRYDSRTRALRITRQLQRQTWEHGCADPHACGSRYHRTRPCPESCKRHTRTCPPPCTPDCTSHARWCPQRRGGGLVDVDVKSKAGKRGIILPGPLAELLEQHRAAQAVEREHAGSLWEDSGWMFAQPNGRPIDQTMDRNEWKRLLADADVLDARLHDARHTAATVCCSASRSGPSWT